MEKGKLGGAQMPPVDLRDTEAVKCDKCGCEVFEQGILLRKISPLLTGTGQPGLVPVAVFKCAHCNQILEEYLPEELKGVYKATEEKLS